MESWREKTERTLDEVGTLIEAHAEEPWEVEVYGLVVKAWAALRDHRQDQKVR